MNDSKVLNVRKGDFSWEVDFEKAKLSDSGSMNFHGGVDFEVKNFNDEDKSEPIIFGQCKIKIEINQRESEEQIACFKVNYQIEIEPSKKLIYELESENEKEKTENKVKDFIMYILEPYFRYDFEKVMYDAELPKGLLPYGIFKKFES